MRLSETELYLSLWPMLNTAKSFVSNAHSPTLLASGSVASSEEGKWDYGDGVDGAHVGLGLP
jgi:hypothetical protein